MQSEKMNPDIFERLQSREPIRLNDPEYHKINEVVHRTLKLSKQMNNADELETIRYYLGEIIGAKIDETTTIFTPFYTDFGKFIK